MQPQSITEVSVAGGVPPAEQNRSVTPYRPRTIWVFYLHCGFIVANLAIVTLIFLSWINFNSFVADSTASNVYGPTTGLPCASRMLSWMQALFGLSLATKFGLIFIVLTDFLGDHVVQSTNKGFDCMLFTSLVFKTTIPFGFGFKLFWHLCGSVVLADARSCHIRWLDIAPPSDPLYAADLARLKSADAEMLAQLQVLWLVVLLVYLVAVIVFLFGLIICAQNDSIAAAYVIRQLAAEEARRGQSSASVEAQSPPEGITEASELTETPAAVRLSGRYSGDNWLWLATAEPVMAERRRPRARGLTSQDFDDLPSFRFKNIMEHQLPQEHKRKKLSLGHWFERAAEREAQQDAIVVDTAPDMAGMPPATVIPYFVDEGPSLISIASAPDLQVTGGGTGEGTTQTLQASEEAELEAFTTNLPQQSDSRDVDHSSVEMSFRVDPTHGTTQASDASESHELTSEERLQDSSELQGESVPGEAETLPEQIEPPGEEARGDTSIVTIRRDLPEMTPSPRILRTRSVTIGRPPESMGWERRRRGPNGRMTSDDILGYQSSPLTHPAEIRPPRRSIPVAIPQYFMVDAHPVLYHLLLFFVYLLVTLTDVRYLPECCARSPEAPAEDYLDTAIFNFILCCGVPGPSVIKSIFTRIWKCLICEESLFTSCRDQPAIPKRHLTKKDKELLLLEAFEITSEKVTVCCICFNDYHTNGMLKSNSKLHHH